MLDAENISKFAKVLPSEWDVFLFELKKHSKFSRFNLHEFKKIQEHELEIQEKKALRLKKEREKMVIKNLEVKESVTSMDEASCSKPVCSKCNKIKSDNVKLLKDAESLTLEIENFQKKKMI
ncbi:hypothetical protein Hanom_Chr05g00410831 [Helianthus anomalus]